MPPTITVRLVDAAGLIVAGVVLAGAGWLLLQIIGKGSPTRRMHGRYVIAGCVTGWLIGSIGGLIAIFKPRKSKIGRLD